MQFLGNFRFSSLLLKFKERLDKFFYNADHGVFYPQALYDNLLFELTLAPASQVVRGLDASKLVYKLENIQLEYETIRSEYLAKEATSVYHLGKEFTYDHILRYLVVPFSKGIDTRMSTRVNPSTVIFLLFVDQYTAGTRESEKYIFPDIEKVAVSISGSPNMVYNGGIGATDTWREISRNFNVGSVS